MKYIFIILTSILTQNSFSDEYSKSNFEIMNYLKNCDGSGIEYRSKYFDLVSLYKNFKKENPTCKKIHETITDNIDQKDKYLRIEVENVLKKTQCIDLKNASATFLKENLKIHERIKQKEHWLITQAKKLANESEIQIEKSHIAWNLHFCSSADTSEMSYPKLDYLKYLDSIKFKSAPAVVSENGQYIDSCKNITAEGSDDLESFSVSLENAQGSSFHLNYNTFSVADAIKIEDSNGKLIFNSGCTGTNFNKEIDIKIPTLKKKDIKISVDGSCEDNSSGTYWKVQITCDSPEKTLTQEEIEQIKLCDEDISKLRKITKEYIKLSIAKREDIWMRAICHENHYGQVVDKLINSKSYFENKFKRKKEDTRKIREFHNNRPPIREISSTFDSLNRPTPFVYGKDDFIENKKQYCPPKPDKDSNIFKVISYSYCQSGFERLF